MKENFVPKNSALLSRARELRRSMTPQETKLWYQFLRHYPIKIYKQRVIESFVVDFYCSKALLVIELDGAQHYTDHGKQYDLERSSILAKYHLSVLRFHNKDIDLHFEQVCEKIDQTIQARLSTSHPVPPPKAPPSGELAKP